MEIFLGIIIALGVIYFFNRFNVGKKKFWIIFSLIYFTISFAICLLIHNVQPFTENELILQAENILKGQEALSASSNVLLLIYEIIVLKIFHRNVVLKLINIIIYYFVMILMYRIINKFTGKKYAQIFVVLYAMLINVLFNILVVSGQSLFLLFTLLGFDIFYVANKPRNRGIRSILFTICLAIANLIIPNTISIVLVLLITLIIHNLKKKEKLGKVVSEVAICVITYISIMLIANCLLNAFGGDFNYFKPKQVTLSNNYSNSEILSYLSETGINISDYTIGLSQFLKWINTYDKVIFVVVFLFFIIGTICDRNDIKDDCLGYLVWAIVVWCLSSENEICMNLLRPFMYILAADGLKKTLEILKKEKILDINKIKALELKIFSKLKELRENKIIHLLILGFCSLILTRIMLYYSTGSFGRLMYEEYLVNKWVMLYNWLPIFYVMLVIYSLTRRVAISNMIGAVITFIITFVNYFKMKFRNDTLLMEDVTLIKEAMNMQQNYVIKFSPMMIACFIGTVLISVLLYIALDRRREKVRFNVFKRIIVTILLIVFAGFMLDKIYLNNVIYAKTGSNNLEFNVWSSVNQYISRGTMYSFLNSYSGIKKNIPEGYDKKNAKVEMSKYEYSDIDEDKKVNIIGIMLEAYNDFSKFAEIEFAVNPYEKLYEIEAESYFGELVTSIFAGGTIDTERKFLTGYTDLPTFRKSTNSYVKYFKEQGYVVEGSHPCYEWFYNRVNVNRNIGFDNYYFFENRYSSLSGGSIAKDNILFSEILNLYEESKKDDKPYFSFNVTYQNHGPYSTEVISSTEYVVRKEYYTDEEYNIMNNYFEGIENTTENLYDTVQVLKDDEEPVVLIFFGDHNPWLGNDNSVYNMLGINFELDQEEGAYNYYCTPYVIWANDKAKEVLNNDFVGNGNKISPNFLMNKLFELAGYSGNEFMSLSNELQEEIEVINPNFFVCDSTFTLDLDDETEELLNRFYKLQYYWTYDKK